MLAEKIAGTAIDFIVRTDNRSPSGHGYRKVIIFPLRFSASFVEFGRYGHRSVQFSVAFIFFPSSGASATFPTFKIRPFLRGGFKVKRSANRATGGDIVSLAIIIVILATINAAIYRAVFLADFPVFAAYGIQTDHFAATRTDFFHRYDYAAAFFVESGGDGFIAVHYNGARAQTLRILASVGPSAEFILNVWRCDC